MTEQQKDLVISASQLEDFAACPRRWWFKRIMKLPEVQKGYFTFGTVLHACLERYLCATENGRVPDRGPWKAESEEERVVWVDGPFAEQRTDDPVDLFPEGWETILEKGQKVSVTPNEGLLIRKLVTQAIERGIVQRLAGQAIERELAVPVVDGVQLTGFADVFRPAGSRVQFSEEDSDEIGTPPELHDHKSFGESGARYLKQPGPTDEGGALQLIIGPKTADDGTSPNSVGHNQQLLTYAAATSIMDGYRGPVLLRHNQFPKFEDPKGVRKVEALVSGEYVEEHWHWVEDQATWMLKVREIKKWDDTPGPRIEDACSQYGGCSFRDICGRREIPDVYRQKVAIQLEAQAGKPPVDLPLKPRNRKKSKEGTMSDIFARARSQQAARAASSGAAPSAAPAEVQQPAPPAALPAKAPEPPAQPVVSAGGPPWANPGCPACKGKGVNSKKRPCPICDNVAKRAGRPTSISYDFAVSEAGESATARPEAVEALTAMGAPLSWSSAGVAPAAPAAAPVAQPAAAPAEAPAAAPAPAKESPFGNVKSARGSKKKRETAAALQPPAPTPAPDADYVEASTEVVAESSDVALPKAVINGMKGGRPKVGITIFINAAQIKGPQRQLLTAQELLERVGAELAKDMGADSYWVLDSFKRRDRIRQKSEAIAATLAKTTLIVPSLADPDVASLVASLIPHADFVVEGLR